MTLNQKLGALAGGLAVIALLLASRKDASDVDLAALARTVEREEDHVDAIELAKWMRDQKPGLRIIDVRSREEYDQYHIPLATSVPLADVTRLQVKPGETVVLYSEGGTHAAQAWFFLKAQGVKDVYFLRDGLNDWISEVMSPSLPLTPEVRELVEYFGGEPSDSPASSATVQERVQRLKRRTC